MQMLHYPGMSAHVISGDNTLRGLVSVN